MVLKRLVVLLLVVMLTAFTGNTLSSAQNGETLVVTWVDSGDLWLWRADQPEARVIAEGGVMRPLFSPDSQHIAFIRSRDADSLWVIQTDGSGERLLFDIATLPPQESGVPIVMGAVQWADANTLYFRVARRPSGPAFAFGDVYHTQIDTGEITPLPEADDAWLTPSPDGSLLALAYPGTYGENDGVVRITDALMQAEVSAWFAYVGASSGSEYPFFPQIFWEADGGAIRFAIPDADLIYHDGSGALTELWRLPVGGQPAEKLGEVEASFFGQPQWSGDSQQVVYLQRMGGTASNELALIVANGDGSSPTTAAESGGFSFAQIEWINGRAQFVYEQGEPGVFWLGTPDAAPRRLPNADERMVLPLFPGGDWVVFESYPAWNGGARDVTELRYARLDQPDQPSTLIVSINRVFAQADAGLLRP